MDGQITAHFNEGYVTEDDKSFENLMNCVNQHGSIRESVGMIEAKLNRF